MRFTKWIVRQLAKVTFTRPCSHCDNAAVGFHAVCEGKTFPGSSTVMYVRKVVPACAACLERFREKLGSSDVS